MSYRPITDVWILARSKQKYYGSYPAGFLHRARALLGVGINEPVLHVCSGAIRQYPYRGLGPNDKLLDLNPLVKPDFLQDARERFPRPKDFRTVSFKRDVNWEYGVGGRAAWGAVLIDRPYTDEDADKYIPWGLGEGHKVLPSANLLVKNGIDVVPVGGCVGILDYLWPGAPKSVKVRGKLKDRAKEVAVIAVGTGRNSRARWFTVWERLV